MKQIKLYLLPIVALAVLAGCNRVKETDSDFDNVVYLQNALKTNTDKISFRATDFTAERDIQAALALPVEEDVTVTVAIDLSLVDVYSKSYGVKCSAPEEYMYELSETQLLIPAGNVLSTKAVLSFTSLPDIDLGDIRVLPVTLKSNNAGIDILNGSKTIYFVLQKGAIIITAANIAENFLTVPGFETASGAVMTGLSQVTMEGLINCHGFVNGLNTFMGIEGHFLVRFGDTGYASDQIQLVTGAVGGSNAPTAAVSPKCPTDQWVHVAITWNFITREYIVYYNGEIKASGSISGTGTSLNLTRTTDNLFYIGRAYDNNRWLNGEVSEFRIWNVVRTQDEILNNFYEVDPDTVTGLIAYWKFDEGSGNIVKDHSGNGNDAKADQNLKWVPVSLPEE